jgi:hypothetical protein
MPKGGAASVASAMEGPAGDRRGLFPFQDNAAKSDFKNRPS